MNRANRKIKPVYFDSTAENALRKKQDSLSDGRPVLEELWTLKKLTKELN